MKRNPVDYDDIDALMAEKIDMDGDDLYEQAVKTQVETKKKNAAVTVCGHCLRASCWQGVFPCEHHRYARTVQRTKTELRTLGRESEHYWE